jgi:hypothetical protein
MGKGVSLLVKFLRGLVIAILAILTAGAAFCVLLMSVLYLASLMEPVLGGFRYIVSLIATVLIANFVCCKIVKPVCDVSFRNRRKKKSS